VTFSGGNLNAEASWLRLPAPGDEIGHCSIDFTETTGNPFPYTWDITYLIPGYTGTDSVSLDSGIDDVLRATNHDADISYLLMRRNNDVMTMPFVADDYILFEGIKSLRNAGREEQYAIGEYDSTLISRGRRYVLWRLPAVGGTDLQFTGWFSDVQQSDPRPANKITLYRK
jgi:hypothetical protein